MRKRNLLMTFIAIALTLSFASQVLAQAPIEGWDKAKFGMSPGELREAYKEEEKYYEDEIYEELDFIKNYYGSDPEKMESKLKSKESSKEQFWYERKECWSKEENGIGYPYQLSNTWLRVLGHHPKFIHFEFVDNQLGVISISVAIDSIWTIWEKEAHKFTLKRTEKLTEFKNTLIEKYGDYFKKTEEEAEQTKVETLIWVDENGNTLVVENHFWQRLSDSKFGDIFEYRIGLRITYFDKALTELWEKKEEQWKIEVAEWKIRGEELRLKGLESF